MIFTGLRFAGETACYFTRSKVQARLQFFKNLQEVSGTV